MIKANASRLLLAKLEDDTKLEDSANCTFWAMKFTSHYKKLALFVKH